MEGVLTGKVEFATTKGPVAGAPEDKLRTVLDLPEPISPFEAHVLKRMVKDKPQDSAGAISAVLGLDVALKKEELVKLDGQAKSGLKSGLKDALGLTRDTFDE